LILVWLPKASSTRFSQLDYIAQHSPKAAITMDEQIERQVDQLIAQPGMGRPGRKQGTRELVISRTPFIVIFRVKPKAKRIEIMRVLHTSQKYP
jgi:toxin ParE1/3/4